jgi:AcrR family transcriptional regulator
MTITELDCPAASRPPGRPRSERADRAIVDATLELLAEAGVAGTSIEAIAARAGVGKATIYRRWPNKDALVVETLASLNEELPEVSGSCLRDDLVTLVDVVRRKFAGSLAGRILPRVMAEGPQHPALLERYFTCVIQPRREVLLDVLRRAVASGELRPDVDLQLVLTLLVGSGYYEILTGAGSGRRSPRRASEQIVDMVLDGIRAR